jgi:simple sugar transport system ATP-binding protein
MGDNGAGKSTLVKIIAGNYPQSEGTIALDGREVACRKPSDARGAGIEIVYQDLALCDNLTAAENVYLGRELRRAGPFRILDCRHVQARPRAIRGTEVETAATWCGACLAASARPSPSRTRLADQIVLMDEPRRHQRAAGGGGAVVDQRLRSKALPWS